MKTHHAVIGAGVLLAGGLLYRMNRTAKRLVTLPLFWAPRIPDFQRIVFPLDVKLKNPTGGALKINWPFIELLHENVSLGSSQSLAKTVRVEPHGETILRDFQIEVPFVNAANLAKPLWDFVRGRRESIPLTVRVSSEADATLTLIPVEFTQTINITKNGSANT